MGRGARSPSDLVVLALLQGGLGNQLFQAAAAFALAVESGRTWAVRPPTHEFSATPLTAIVPSAVVHPHEGPRSRREDLSRRARKVARRLRLAAPRPTRVHVRQTPDRAAEIRPQSLPLDRDRIILDGYFQHPTWWADHLAEFLSLVHLPDRAPPASSAPEMTGGLTVSLRRGDYVRLGWDLPFAYYRRAVRMFGSLPEPVHVIGDDELANLAIAEWLAASTGAAIGRVGSGDELEDLHTLVSSDHIIMSNSTFCWWGVMIGEERRRRVGGTVTYPTPWSTAGSEGTAHFATRDWVAVDATRG